MKNKVCLPFLLILSLVTCCIEVDISVSGFPYMANYFIASESMIQLTMTYNFLGFCLASLLYGPLSECYGRRKIMLIGNAIMSIGAVGCVLAKTIEALLIARFIQGIGAATSAVIAFAIIADVYQGVRSAKIIGIMNTILTSVMAIAPIVGGFINNAIGWHGNYILVALISIISWLSLWLGLPETKTYPEEFKPRKALRDYRILLLNPQFLYASLIPSVMFSAYMSFIAGSPFLYTNTFGLSIIAYVAHQGIIIESFAFISLFSGKIISVLGERKCIIYGVGLNILGPILMLILGFVSSSYPYLMTGFMIIFSIGFAIAYPVIFSRSLEVFPAIKGAASSIIMSMRALLVSAFTGLAGYLYNGQLIMVASVLLFACIIILILSVCLLRVEPV